ncbi:MULTISPECIES: hypothetical protein [Methylobacterium]|uniref:Uncharacterized protein n=2 Tax=Methylobacterium TaxID=407 RepID=A0ABQ4SUJ7_9HYPH|nr:MULTISPECIES: hypothetical protein [Methylobacterium]PIU05521.1 MAG: hypothetical protein COT56_14090 [Methylobacterium sp. CG09_land_8_20_14_0_10_71_15]PIU13592.1 MAG: hypothetical protein COT28_10870 [Methylobacterium sp. CG08_land_8_20_14_0_20_71_15]GBU17025.1 hypothetical protein AwMethylo_12400 [Methylobacterium sp.]GJD91150.1 hypothetical protein BHAOGJBA_4698 [Methylobacterium hispanicum]GJE06885.1 hypothetical protein AOPFMNJM_2208 [Methylobacterium jeotgali]
MSAYTDISPAAVLAAYGCARGSYQRAVLNGSEAWSGSTLTGRAARYGSKYRTSREELLARLEAHPDLAVEERLARRRTVAIVTREEAAAAGGAYAHIEAEAERQRIEQERADDEAQRLAFLQRVEEYRVDMAALAEI